MAQNQGGPTTGRATEQAKQQGFSDQTVGREDKCKESALSSNKPRRSQFWLVQMSFMVLSLILVACGPTQTGTGNDLETTTGGQAVSPTAFPTTECGDIAGNREGAEQVLEDTTSVPEEGGSVAEAEC